MEQAQVALQVVINNLPDEANALARRDLIQAIGRGIGNNAAHEIAHQFLLKCCKMEVLTSQDQNAAATYNNGDGDGDPSPQVPNSDPAPYTGFGKDHRTAIHWETQTEQALTKCLASGWINYGLVTCAAKLDLSEIKTPFDSGSIVFAKAINMRSAQVPAKRNKSLPWILRRALFWRR